MKSFAVSPLTNLPFLSFTTTCLNNQLRIQRQLEGFALPGGAALPPTCCAHIPHSQQEPANRRAMSESLRIVRTSTLQSLQAPHGVCLRRQPEGRAVHNRIPSREHAMIQNIRRIDLHIKIERIHQSERPRHGTIQAERVRPGN